MDVKIRFNNAFPKDSDKKWRVLVDGTETLVDAVEIRCKSWTTDDEVDVSKKGEQPNIQTKHHVTCKAKNVTFSRIKNTKTAIIV